MNLLISTATTGDSEHRQIIACAFYLKESGRLHDFVTSALELRAISINFDWDDPFPPAALKDIVGSFTWTRLSSARFGKIRTSEETFMDFYIRHASTLRKIRLDTIQLSAGCDWSRLLEKIRKALTLNEALVVGQLSVQDMEEMTYKLAPDINGKKISRVVQEYLLGSGDAPLLDLSDIEMMKWDVEDDIFWTETFG